MTKTFKSKGRPLKDIGKRNKKIDIRFTDEEYDVILELEKTLGFNKAELIRNRVLKGAKASIINAKELIVLLDGIGAELGRCGNNINQLAKYANILNKRGITSPVVLERFNFLFSQYIENQQLLETTFRKIVRVAEG